MLIRTIPAGLNPGQRLRCFGQIFCEIGEDGSGLPNEHTGIPEVLAAVQVFFGRFLVRFFLEGLDGVKLVLTTGTFAALAAFDIPQGRAGKCRPDAESHHIVRTVVDKAQSVPERLLEHLGRLDDLIGGDHGDGGLGVVFSQDGGGQPDGPGRIAHRGLGDDIVEGQLRKVFADHIRIAGVRQDDDISQIENRPQSLETPAKKRLTVKDFQNLLGAFLPAQRPQPLARPARHNHCVIHFRYPS